MNYLQKSFFRSLSGIKTRKKKYEKLLSNVTSVKNVLLVQNNIQSVLMVVLTWNKDTNFQKNVYLNWHFYTLSIKL